MKKFLVLFLAFSLVGGAAFAQDLGLTAGLEFNIGQLNHEHMDAMDTAELRPFLRWENSELVENLELSAEIGLPFWMSRAYGGYGYYYVDDDFWMGMDIELDVAYNLSIMPEGFFTFGLNFLTYLDLQPGDADAVLWLSPRVRYTHDLNGISVFGQLEFPLYLGTGGDALELIGLDILLGMNMGLAGGIFGFDVEINNWLKDYAEETSFFEYLTLTPSFEIGPWYAEIAFGIPTMENGMDYYGMTITPEVRYNIMDNLQVWLNLPVFNIGAAHDDVGIGLGVGIQFSF